MSIRFSPVWTGVGVAFVWLHGATTATVVGDNMLQRFFMFTVAFVGPVLTLWICAKSVVSVCVLR